MLYVYWLASLVLLTVIAVYVHKRQTYTIVSRSLQLQKDAERQTLELQSYQTELISSIQYAKEIQDALLPGSEYVLRHLPLSFIYYNPKELVGGDFFWFHKVDNDTFILICADCTGHGIPGALMTMLGNSFLNQIILEDQIYELPKILHALDEKVRMTLRQTQPGRIQDGMDISIIKINKRTRELHFAGGRHRIVLFKQNMCHELRGDKFSIGGYSHKNFTETKYLVDEEDTLYMFSDGYVDQFGGPDDKKFSTKRFYEMLTIMQSMTMNDQRKFIVKTIDDWKYGYEQTDDITVIGVKF